MADAVVVAFRSFVPSGSTRLLLSEANDNNKKKKLASDPTIDRKFLTRKIFLCLFLHKHRQKEVKQICFENYIVLIKKI